MFVFISRLARPSNKAGGPKLAVGSKARKLRRGSVVGVEITSDAIYMVRARRDTRGDFTIQGWHAIPCEAAELEDPRQLATRLKSELNAFCPKEKRLDLWSCVRSSETDLRFVKVPPVGPKQLTNVVRWVAGKEMELDDSRTVFDYLPVEEVSDKKAVKLLVAAYTAPRAETDALQQLFSQAGMAPAGLTLAPFALQNLFRGVSDTPPVNSACLHIATDHSCIHIFKGSRLALTRTVKTGIDSMVEELMQLATSASKLSRNQAINLLGRLPQIVGGADAAAEADGSEKQAAVRTKVLTIIRPVLDRLTRQLERTLDHFSSQPANAPVSRIYLICTLPVHDVVSDMLFEQLGIPAEPLHPFKMTQIGLTPELKPEAAVLTAVESAGFVTAVGLALADNQRTPNLLYTCREKDDAAAVSRINRIIFAVFILLIGTGSLVFGYQQFQIRHQQQAIHRLQEQLGRFDAGLTREAVEGLLKQVQQHRQGEKDYSRRYRLLAAISEVVALTPSEIGLLLLELDMGPRPTASDPASSDPKAGRMRLEGLITEDAGEHQNRFSGFIVRLDHSALFTDIIVLESQTRPFKGNEALQFQLALTLAQP